MTDEKLSRRRPEISVIIPTWRPGGYLRECLDSVFRQTLDWNLYEIIVVINGDAEPYRSGILRHAASAGRKITVAHAPDAGVCNARNAGLGLASGRYICFVDDDDILSPGYLGALYSAATPGAVAVSDVRTFVTDPGRTGRDYLSEAYSRLSLHGGCDGPYPARALLCVCCGKIIPAAMIAGRRFPKFRTNEDMLFMTVISDRITAVRCAAPAAVYYRRIRSGSLSRAPRSLGYMVALTLRGMIFLAKTYLRSPSRYSRRLFADRMHLLLHGLRLHLFNRTKCKV